MVSDSASLVLFAIKAATKLGEQARLAYVDSTRRRELTLPLPKFFAGTTAADAVSFFEHPKLGQPYLTGTAGLPPEPRLQQLVDQFRGGQHTPAVAAELVDFHVKYRNIRNAEENPDDAGRLAPEDMLALLSVQQWRKGTDPTPSTLHRVAGTLVELGIDYALTSPNLCDRHSSAGKLALGFLTALDEVNFTEADLSELPARLFVAALETTAEHPELLSGDAKAQELIRVTTKGLSSDVAMRIHAIEADAALDPIAKRHARRDVQDWAELLFRGTLASGGRLVLSNPATFLGTTKPGKSALVSTVGTSVLNFALADGNRFGALLSRPGVETILDAALRSVAEHPEILGHSDNQALTAYLSSLAGDLAALPGGLAPANLLPEIARMTLQRTSQNLALFWPELATRPEYNALGAAAKIALEILAAPPADGQKWRPAFRREDLLGLTELVLDELVSNPGWLIDPSGKVSPALREVLAAIYDAVRAEADPRLGSAAGTALVRIAFAALATRTEFADPLPGKGPVIGEIVAVVLRAAFAAAAQEATAARMARLDAITGLLRETLVVMARHPLTAAAVKKLEATLKKEMAQVAGGRGLDLVRYATALEKALAT